MVRSANTITAIGLLLAGLAASSGCGGQDGVQLYPVQGQVTLQGKPLANALVVLHPKDSSNPEILPARGQTDADGKFSLSTFTANDGAPAGEYAVTVEQYKLIETSKGNFEPGPNVLSEKLSSPKSTYVYVTVAANPTTLSPIEVKR